MSADIGDGPEAVAAAIPEAIGEKKGIPAPFREPLDHTARWLRSLDPVSVLARLSLIGCLLWLANWVAQLNRFLLAIFAVLWLWRFRPRISFGTIFGSARWAGRRELVADNMLGHRDGLLLGRFREPEVGRFQAFIRLFTFPLRDSEYVIRCLITALSKNRIPLPVSETGPFICAPRGLYTHLLTVAPAGAGKGVGVVIPNLLNYKHSVIVIDLKAENYSKTAETRRAWGQNVIAINPFNVRHTDTGEAIPSATLNPLSIFDVESPDLVDQLRTVAESLVIRSAKDGDPHWPESAVNLIHAVLIFVMCFGLPQEQHLNCVKAILSDKDDLERCLLEMCKMRDLSLRGEIMANKAASLLSIPPKEYGSVVALANRNLEFLNSERIMPTIETTSFDVRSIAKVPTSIYLILPAEYLQSHANLMRLWINTLMLVIKQAGAGEKHEILFILDEIAQLGEMRPIEEAITLLRGWGIRLWFFVQSIHQIEVSYPGPRAKVLLGNFSIQQYFGISDPETAAHVSRMVGKRTEISPNYNQGWSQGSSGGQSGSSSHGTSGGRSVGAFERDHIKPEEVLREPARVSVFLFRQGRFPTQAQRLTYYDDPDFQPDAEVTPPLKASLASCMLCIFGLIGATYLVESSPSISPLILRHIPGTPSPSPLSIKGQENRPVPAPILPPADIPIRCRVCGNEGDVPASYAGQTIRCRTCDTRLAIPLPSE